MFLIKVTLPSSEIVYFFKNVDVETNSMFTVVKSDCKYLLYRTFDYI